MNWMLEKNMNFIHIKADNFLKVRDKNCLVILWLYIFVDNYIKDEYYYVITAHGKIL